MDVTFVGGASPSHSCMHCGALWRKWEDGSWNLRSKEVGACCDNAVMGDQIVPVTPAAIRNALGPMCQL